MYLMLNECTQNPLSSGQGRGDDKTTVQTTDKNLQSTQEHRADVLYVLGVRSHGQPSLCTTEQQQEGDEGVNYELNSAQAGTE